MLLHKWLRATTKGTDAAVRVDVLCDGLGSRSRATKDAHWAYCVCVSAEFLPDLMKKPENLYGSGIVIGDILTENVAHKLVHSMVDAMFANPPCQPFTKTNHGEGRRDPRVAVFTACIRFIVEN
jgi:site-specific DNA-cytosine methylase